MKKFFLAALVTVTLGTSVFATDVNKVNYRVKQNFASHFSGATNVDWSVKEDVAKATFMYDDEKVEAYYNLSGELVGSSSNLTIEKLPVSVKRNLAKKYSSYTINEVIKFEDQSETNYYIAAEKDNQKLVLKASPFGLISVFKRS